MTKIEPNGLTIELQDSEPQQRRNMLIQAIAAAMRWRAFATDTYINDGQNLYVLAQLLEELAQEQE